MNIPENRLVYFLYHLMRDELPCGTIEGIVQRLESINKEDAMKYTNIDLEVYSKKLSKRILI